MSSKFQAYIEKLKQATLFGRGETDASLRQTVAHYAQSISNNQIPEDGRIASDLIPYLNTVVLHAYKVTDATIEQLKANGHSEDEIYEITISAALGAGLARYEKGMELLNNSQTQTIKVPETDSAAILEVTA